VSPGPAVAHGTGRIARLLVVETHTGGGVRPRNERQRYPLGMTLAERITQDLTAAMKAQNVARTSTLRLAKAAIKNREIEKHAGLDDGEAVRVLQGLVKQREDAAEQYLKASRPELADKELAEIVVLKAYLPAEVSDAEIATAVDEAVAGTGAASVKDMGKAMKAALAALGAGGKSVDGKRVSEAVRRRLGA